MDYNYFLYQIFIFFVCNIYIVCVYAPISHHQLFTSKQKILILISYSFSLCILNKIFRLVNYIMITTNN